MIRIVLTTLLFLAADVGLSQSMRLLDINGQALRRVSFDIGTHFPNETLITSDPIFLTVDSQLESATLVGEVFDCYIGNSKISNSDVYLTFENNRSFQYTKARKRFNLRIVLRNPRRLVGKFFCQTATVRILK